MDVVAIVVAAGRGTRAGEGPPKQYRTVAGVPALARALAPFIAHPGVSAVLCAIGPDDEAAYESATAGLGAGKLLPPVTGGATRQDSVRNAVRALPSGLPSDGVCLVHDAARIFADEPLIDRAIAAGRRFGAAVPAIAVTDTVKQVASDGRVLATLDRDTLRSVQTPQAFRRGVLADLHGRAEAAGRSDFTDDGGLAEWAGLDLHVFPGDPGNMKVTHPGDFDAAERRLAPTLLTRLATGFDVHIFGPGDGIWLGGILIPHDWGVVAHSDGDVVLHALTDAVLGTMSDGDIGTHFPPSEERWRGAASDQFLRYAIERVRERGGIVDHLDATILCERPKVGPHRDAMRERIASIAGVGVEAVSVKATTTERLGFTGRGEGIAAQAAATVRLPASRS